MSKSKRERFMFFSGSTLKIIALVSMLIDHTAAVLVPPYDSFALYWVYWLMRGIGRLAFPIFCFLLVEGMHFTSNVKKYLFRLAFFALLSEIPFDLAFSSTIFDSSYQNVFFTLFLGAFLIYLLEQVASFDFPVLYLLKVICILFVCALAFSLKTDYGYKGVLLILAFYVSRKKGKGKGDYLVPAAVLFIFWGFSLEIAALFSLFLISGYNGERGMKLKYFFYFFYPLHLFLLYLVKIKTLC